mmetsp:Transcript_19610/g.28008  ORF Transcript_19610/g.28008 Transcript_19610/m.28008 type:complete len:94 (-) Transcript_19610:399-680(-)
MLFKKRCRTSEPFKILLFTSIDMELQALPPLPFDADKSKDKLLQGLILEGEIITGIGLIDDDGPNTMMEVWEELFHVEYAGHTLFTARHAALT